MARSTIGLTDTAVRQLKPIGMGYVKSDGKGLHLRVRVNGSKLWNPIEMVCNPTRRPA